MSTIEQGYCACGSSAGIDMNVQECAICFASTKTVRQRQEELKLEHELERQEKEEKAEGEYLREYEKYKKSKKKGAL